MQKFIHSKLLRPLLLIAISFAAVASVLPAVPLAHATTEGTPGACSTLSTSVPVVYINATKEPILTGGSVIYNVCVANMPTFNHWDVIVTVGDSSILNFAPSANVSFTGSILSPRVEVTRCVNGAGLNCVAGVGNAQGAIESVVANGTDTTVASGSGLLFTLNYTGLTGPGTTLQLQQANIFLGSDPIVLALRGQNTCPAQFPIIVDSLGNIIDPGTSHVVAPDFCMRTRVKQFSVPQNSTVSPAILSITAVNASAPFDVTASVVTAPSGGPTTLINNGTVTAASGVIFHVPANQNLTVILGSAAGTLIVSTGLNFPLAKYVATVTVTHGTTSHTVKLKMPAILAPTIITGRCGFAAPTTCNPSGAFYGAIPTLLIDAPKGQPLLSEGKTINYSVDMTFASAFTFFDVTVREIQQGPIAGGLDRVITPMSVVPGSIVTTIHLKCINGLVVINDGTIIIAAVGTPCLGPGRTGSGDPGSAPGDVRFVADTVPASGGSPTTPVNLYTITYMVTGPQAFEQLYFFQSVVSNGKTGGNTIPQPQDPKSVSATYGGGTDFLLHGSLSPPNPPIEVTQGSSVTTQISLLGFNGFADPVTLKSSGICSPSGGSTVTPVISLGSTLMPPINTTIPVTVSTTQTTTSTKYICTITATDTASTGVNAGQVRTFPLTVFVLPLGQPAFAKSGLTFSSKIPLGGLQTWNAFVHNPTLTPKFVQIVIDVTSVTGNTTVAGTPFLVGSGICCPIPTGSDAFFQWNHIFTVAGTYSFTASIIFDDVQPGPLNFIATTSGTAAVFTGSFTGTSIIDSGSFTVG